MLIDILPEIFRNLSVTDHLRCRQVCQAWRYVVERDFLKELCMYVRGTYFPDVWIIENQAIDPRSALTVNSLGVLADPNFQQTFRNLKRLMIKAKSKYHPWKDNFEEKQFLNHLNSLHQLEHLELHFVPTMENFELKLTGLKKLFYLHPYNYGYGSDKPLPASLETIGFYTGEATIWPINERIFAPLKDRLKELILFEYSS